MIVKAHRNDRGDIILAVCDAELIGKLIQEGDKQLDLTSDFYAGREVDEEEAGDLMRNAHIVNIVGKRAVNLALKEEIIEELNVKTISGTPYAQAVVDYGSS